MGAFLQEVYAFHQDCDLAAHASIADLVKEPKRVRSIAHFMPAVAFHQAHELRASSALLVDVVC